MYKLLYMHFTKVCLDWVFCFFHTICIIHISFTHFPTTVSTSITTTRLVLQIIVSVTRLVLAIHIHMHTHIYPYTNEYIQPNAYKQMLQNIYKHTYTHVWWIFTRFSFNDPTRRFTYGHLVTTFAWFIPIWSIIFTSIIHICICIINAPIISHINTVLGSDGRCVQKTGT